MERGDNVLITYNEMENKTILATYYETINGTHMFEDSSGLFGVTEKSIKNGKITLEVIEED